MNKATLIRLILVIFSALLIAAADALIKVASKSANFWQTLKSPWMLLVYVLYFIQILLAIGIFVYKGELAIYTNLFIIFYSILGVALGVFYFQESLTAVQIAGIVLALFGAVLISK